MNVETKNVLVAAREAVQRAYAAAGEGPCEACGARPASPYAFAYAREVGGKVVSEGMNRYTSISEYDSVGARVVNLCPRCVAAKSRQLSKNRLAGTIVTGVVFVAAIALAWWLHHGDLTLPLVVAGVIVTGLAYAAQRRSASNPSLGGSAKALELHEAELRAQGYNKFWSDPSVTFFAGPPKRA